MYCNATAVWCCPCASLSSIFFFHPANQKRPPPHHISDHTSLGIFRDEMLTHTNQVHIILQPEGPKRGGNLKLLITLCVRFAVSSRQPAFLKVIACCPVAQPFTPSASHTCNLLQLADNCSLQMVHRFYPVLPPDFASLRKPCAYTRRQQQRQQQHQQACTGNYE